MLSMGLASIAKLMLFGTFKLEELSVNVVLLRQSMAVCLCAFCDRGLLFALRSFLSVSHSDWLTVLLKQPFLEINL